MRKLFILALLSLSTNAFSVPCSQPLLIIPDINGDVNDPCLGPGRQGIGFVSATIAGNRLTLVKRIDKASPQLFLISANGHHIRASIAAGNAEYKFSDVEVVSLTHTATPAAKEEIVFTFGSAVTHDPTKGQDQAVPRELRIAGNARPAAASVVFGTLGDSSRKPASAWQVVAVRPRVNATLQFGTTQAAVLTPMQTQATQQCIEVQSGGATVARYVVLGKMSPRGGGNIVVEKMQLQIPPAATCGWQQGSTNSPTWNLQQNTAQ